MNRAQMVAAMLAHRAAADALKAELEHDAREALAREGMAATYRLPTARLTTNVVRDKNLVTDQRALIAWLTDRYPHAVETRTVVINWEWVNTLLNSLVKVDDTLPTSALCDAATGEIVPGVRFEAGGDFLSISVVPAQATRVRLARAAQQYARGEAPMVGIDQGESDGNQQDPDRGGAVRGAGDHGRGEAGDGDSAPAELGADSGEGR